MRISSLWAAISTYSVIPTPRFAWTEESMKYSLCFFPVVGLFCGGGLAAWYALCLRLGAGGVLFAAGAVCLPLLLTGGIHMDGYMDTVDALASHQPAERKLEIMKDHHSGAFAVIYCAVYLIACLGLFHQLYGTGQLWSVCPGYVLSRALSALCVIRLPNARKNGMLAAVTGKARNRRCAVTLSLIAAAAWAAMVWLNAPAAAVTAVMLGGWFWYYRRLAMGQFGGVTGDTAGFFLQICELFLPLGAWIGGLVV